MENLEIAVLGTGPVGRAVAGGLARVGHEVTLGTRDPGGTAGREEYAAWAAEHPGVGLATFAQAAGGAALVVNAAGGDVALGVLASAGGENLAGKVLLDISNPLDSSRGFPPTLFVKDDDSLAETIQRAHPDARVVKSLNTMNNALMVDPQRLGEDTTVFVSGDDPDAKAVVTALLHQLGHGDVIDLGGIETARGPEMWLPLWIRINLALGGNDFNLKIVRGPTLR
ncbi:NADPH-dependent F420 reductase [Nocardioides halotolerans]|uniref:NADPH-dependent F420 reductase n=1 Tax=Nocardioides halotolerans TaxID=433660 RepID=UPI0003FD446F|nr:NAD(P)-binding domain-containing protein [Nocardioides halotolerans]